MNIAHDGVLAVHVAVGAGGLVAGVLAILAERCPPYRSGAGAAYHWAVLAVALSAAGLVAFDFSRLWWLLPLAALSYSLALVGSLAPLLPLRWWVRAYAHGQGGSYIALVTALLVVSLDGTAQTVAWFAPTLVGVPLIERRVASIRVGACR
ncbi:MAG TPA: hypothetical protein VHG69_07380 [Thermoleophilaceae bacterium]|nr:hypothetical protein [Thermoleophilaceae bacterium]